MNQKKLIPISAIVVFGAITLADLHNNGKLPGSKEWLGFVVVYTMLSIGSDLGLEFANGFALLVMISVLLTRGLEALEFLLGKLGNGKQKQKKPMGRKVLPPEPVETETVRT